VAAESFELAINAVLKERLVNKTRQSKRKANDRIQTLITHEHAAATTLLTFSECSPTWYKRRKQEREKNSQNANGKGKSFADCAEQAGKSSDGKEEGRREHERGREGDGVRSDYKLADDFLTDEEFPDHGDDDNTFVDEESLDYQPGNSLFVDEARQYWMLFICTTS